MRVSAAPYQTLGLQAFYAAALHSGHWLCDSPLACLLFMVHTMSVGPRVCPQREAPPRAPGKGQRQHISQPTLTGPSDVLPPAPGGREPSPESPLTCLLTHCRACGGPSLCPHRCCFSEKPWRACHGMAQCKLLTGTLAGPFPGSTRQRRAWLGSTSTSSGQVVLGLPGGTPLASWVPPFDSGGADRPCSL